MAAKLAKKRASQRTANVLEMPVPEERFFEDVRAILSAARRKAYAAANFISAGVPWSA